MTLPASGPISLYQIADEFSLPRSTPFPSGFYGKGGAPSSGALSFSNFYGRGAYINPSVSISPAGASATGSAGTSVTTNLVTANPSNGQAPFTYSWSTTGTGWTITSPSAASTAFRHIANNQSDTATVTVTDARGNTAQASINISANNNS